MSDRLGFSLTQLRYFVVSAELGNISEAAERLCASQSTVSSAVMKLERQLGVQLLLRHHARGVTLTPSGRHLLREARALLGQARNLKAQGDALAGHTVEPAGRRILLLDRPLPAAPGPQDDRSAVHGPAAERA